MCWTLRKLILIDTIIQWSSTHRLTFEIKYFSILQHQLVSDGIARLETIWILHFFVDRMTGENQPVIDLSHEIKLKISLWSITLPGSVVNRKSFEVSVCFEQCVYEFSMGSRINKCVNPWYHSVYELKYIFFNFSLRQSENTVIIHLVWFVEMFRLDFNDV